MISKRDFSVKSKSEKNEMGQSPKNVTVQNFVGGFCVQHATIIDRRFKLPVRFIVWSWRNRDSAAHQILN